MQKWEYSEIVYFGPTFGGSERYKYIVHRLPSEAVYDIKEEAIGLTITQLGHEGWELVSAYESMFGKERYWFFKRPLP